MEKLVIQSNINNLVEVERFVSTVCDTFNVNNYAGTISMALLQAVENAIIHGNQNNPDLKVTITSELCRGGICFTVADEGRGFNYQQYGDLPLSDEQGTGIFLMKSLSDKLTFINNGSTVRMEYLINGIEATRAVERIMVLRNYHANKLVHV